MCGKHSIKVCVCCFSQCPGISVPRVLIPDVIRGHSSLTRRICFKANFSFLIKLKSALTCIDLTCRLGTMTTMSVPPPPESPLPKLALLNLFQRFQIHNLSESLRASIFLFWLCFAVYGNPKFDAAHLPNLSPHQSIWESI